MQEVSVVVLMREGARGQCGCLDEGGCKRLVWLS